jgi:hypothetical protein
MASMHRVNDPTRRHLLALAALLVLAPHLYADEPVYRELDWIQMLPDDDFQALFNPPEIDHGYGEDEGSGALLTRQDSGTGAARFDRFEQALVSVKVIPELNEAKVSIPGFIVPLAYDAKERVTEFFLVPYFGACIHTPPPPPNQIVHVSFPDGLELHSIYDAFFIDGTLYTSRVENDMAIAAYSMKAVANRPYGEE